MPNTCDKCPNKKSKLGCPSWIGPEAGIIETNIATGEERMMIGCYFQVMPKLMTHVIAASNRPAAAMEGLRNSFSTIAKVAEKNQLLTPQLEDHTDVNH